MLKAEKKQYVSWNKIKIKIPQWTQQKKANLALKLVNPRETKAVCNKEKHSSKNLVSRVIQYRIKGFSKKKKNFITGSVHEGHLTRTEIIIITLIYFDDSDVIVISTDSQKESNIIKRIKSKAKQVSLYVYLFWCLTAVPRPLFIRCAFYSAQGHQRTTVIKETSCSCAKVCAILFSFFFFFS